MKRTLTTILFILFTLTMVFSQDVLWEKSLGGVKSEYLHDIKATPDFGFILAGSSLSDKSGNKTGIRKGDLDYFIWKMDENGNEEWQRSFGGSGADHLYSINLTREGGYILGGCSTSPKSGDKQEDNKGYNDFWIIKLNPEGEEEWQITLGGEGNDILLSIEQTLDRGYIIGGTSNSPKGEGGLYDKSENSQGNMDYWVVKLSEVGEIEWQRTLGGKNYEILKSIHQTKDEGYILGGYSNSSESGDKTTKSQGKGDYWIVRLDKDGNLVWNKTIGKKGEDTFKSLVVTEENEYIIGGETQEIDNKNDVNVNWWIIKLDDQGSIQWDKTFDIEKRDRLVSITQTKNGHYLLSGYAETKNHGIKKQGRGIEDYLIIKIEENGGKLWQKEIGGKSSDRLQKTIVTRDGGYVLAGSSNSKANRDKKAKNRGQEDFWIVKLTDKDTELQKDFQGFEIYPNPAEDYVNILVHKGYKDAELQIFDMMGSLILQQTLKQKITPVDIQQLQTGSYVLKVITEDDLFNAKLLKK